MFTRSKKYVNEKLENKFFHAQHVSKKCPHVYEKCPVPIRKLFYMCSKMYIVYLGESRYVFEKGKTNKGKRSIILFSKGM